MGSKLKGGQFGRKQFVIKNKVYNINIFGVYHPLSIPLPFLYFIFGVKC